MMNILCELIAAFVISFIYHFADVNSKPVWEGCHLAAYCPDTQPPGDNRKKVDNFLRILQRRNNYIQSTGQLLYGYRPSISEYVTLSE